MQGSTLAQTQQLLSHIVNLPGLFPFARGGVQDQRRKVPGPALAQTQQRLSQMVNLLGLFPFARGGVQDQRWKGRGCTLAQTQQLLWHIVNIRDSFSTNKNGWKFHPKIYPIQQLRFIFGEYYQLRPLYCT